MLVPVGVVDGHKEPFDGLKDSFEGLVGFEA